MKVKKLGRILVGAAMIMLLACCGTGAGDDNEATRRTQGSGNVQSVLEQQMEKADKDAQDAGKGELGSQNAGHSSSENAGISGSDGAGSQNAGDSGSQDTDSETAQGGGASSQPAAGDIDVDLTVLSSTMVYSEVYNMMYNAPDYVGKVVKMKGLCSVYHDESTDKYYYACIIQDATACCAQGIEFELTEDYRFPDDYPEENEEVCVTGTFDIYYEGQYQYVTLRGATLQ